MPEILERGHLYIAQPPLYKIKKGKKENYLKDEQALNDYLLSAASDAARLVAGNGRTTVTAQQLVEVMQGVIRYRYWIAPFDRKIDVRILDAMLSATNLSTADLKSEDTVTEALTRMEFYLQQNTPQIFPLSFELERDEEHDCFQISTRTVSNGRQKVSVINQDLLETNMFVRLKKLAEELKALGGSPYQILREGEDAAEFTTLEASLDFIMELARKGHSLQRYKGLGEMNPDQLWETTMDPTTRTMLQVRIEDAVNADQLFTVLMGDEVEPRREFIMENALNVSNLDV